MAEGKIVDDAGNSETSVPVTPAGGTDKVVDKKKNADAMSKVKKESEEINGDVEIVVEESIQNMFEGMDLSEEFKNKVSVVFEAAVHEQVTLKTESIQASLEEQMQSQLEESVDDKIGEIVENLDSYLNYVVNEWMQENEVAIESGIKVDMAESLMNGLKDLFSEHNIDAPEETVDVISELEEEIKTLSNKANNVINENIQLSKEIASYKTNKVFDELTEDLTVSQRERLKNLSESLNSNNIDEYSKNLLTLKESFFAESSVGKGSVVDGEEDEILIEEAKVFKPSSDHSSINALVEALNARKSK